MSTSLTVKIQVSGSAAATVSHTITPLDAFDRINVTVPAGAEGAPATLEVEVQPGETGQVRLFLLTASTYGSGLTYSVDEGAEDILLDAPHLLLGAGAVGLLAGPPSKITFNNEMEQEVAIEILVGRKAIPA